jgi:hypothetical protein
MTAQTACRAHRALVDKAAEGQNATLEFILVNHPLDCPSATGRRCRAGPTFRYGPRSTRMTFQSKRSKPIPICR